VERRKALSRALERAGGVDSTPSAAYHPLEPTTLIPLRVGAIRYFIQVHLEDIALPSHINRAEAIGTASAALGVLVAFLPWYAYTAGGSHISVNAFRASLFGDLFFVGVAAAILLLLIGRGFVDDVVTPYIPEVTAHATAAAVAMGSVLIQLILARATGRSLGIGISLALIAAVGLCAAAVLRRLHPNRRRIVREGLSHEGLITP
jgi:hypothetical protein